MSTIWTPDWEAVFCGTFSYLSILAGIWWYRASIRRKVLAGYSDAWAKAQRPISPNSLVPTYQRIWHARYLQYISGAISLVVSLLVAACSRPQAAIVTFFLLNVVTVPGLFALIPMANESEYGPPELLGDQRPPIE